MVIGQLPAPIVNGEGDSFWKRPDFQLWKTRDLDVDLGSSHTAYRRASLIDLLPNFTEIQENVLWTDGWTYVRTYLRTKDRQTDIWDRLYLADSVEEST